MEPTEPTKPGNIENTSESTNPEHEPSTAERFSSDLVEINLAIIKMVRNQNTDASELRQAWSVRAALIENFIDSLEPSLDIPNPRPKAQFDAMVDKATIFEAAGDTIRYLEELDAAETFGLNSNLDEITYSISETLDAKIQELGSTSLELVLKLRGIIEFSSRDYLRELLADGDSYEDLINAIYGIVLDEGGDPGQVLVELGVTE